MVLLLLIISIGYNQQSFAKSKIQDTIQQNFDQETFRASLKELPPKEFARLFIQEYKQDSLKIIIGIEYIENIMLQSEDLLTQFWGNFSLAYSQNHMLHLEESIKSLDEALSIAKKINNDVFVMNALMSKGIYYFNFGEYEKAMESYLEVLHLAKEIKNKEQEQAVSLNIALIKMQTNDFTGADEILQNLLKSIKNEQPKTRHLNTYIALTKASIGIEEYEKAKEYCEIGLDLSDQLQDEEAKFYFYSFLGRIAALNDDYDKSHKLIKKSFQIAEKIKTIDHEIPILFIEKGEVLYKEKKYQEAIDILLKADVLMQKHKLDFIKQEETYALLAKSYNEIGDVKNSIKFYEKANETYKKNDKRQGSISVDIIKKYDLKSLKEELNLAEKKTQKTKTVLYVSVFFALLMVIGLIFFYKKREKDNQRKFTAILKSLEEEKEEETIVAVKVVPEEIVSKKTTKTVVKEVEIIDETKVKLLKKLDNFEAKKSYLSKHCSLNEVAKKLKTNTSYLSKLVNAHKGKSFTAYITDLRVNYAIKRLKEDKKFRSYTIDSIAQEIGFNRSESFSRAFKNKTGLYPSYFIKNLDSQGIE